MAKHAFLSASASHRWINCPPSAKLCEGIKDESSHYAQEGTDCHELCAYLVEMALGRDVEDPTENLTYYSGEMQNCAEEYRDYVLEQFERSKKFCSDPMVFIEQRLDFSRWVENGFGTGDCVIIADEVLHIIDSFIVRYISTCNQLIISLSKCKFITLIFIFIDHLIYQVNQFKAFTSEIDFFILNFWHYTLTPSISAKRFALMKYTHLLSDV